MTIAAHRANWRAAGGLPERGRGDWCRLYLWGKEKLIQPEEENPTLTQFKKEVYSGRSIASELATMGYVVVVIDMFYWGERGMILDEDPTDWRERPHSIPAERVDAFSRRASQSERGRTIYSAGFTWSGLMFWDDIRTVDYLLTRPEVDIKPNRLYRPFRRRPAFVPFSPRGTVSPHRE